MVNNMKLEDIINIYNDATGNTFLILRKKESASSLARGLCSQSIEVLDFQRNRLILTVSEVSIKDVTEILEEKVLHWLFKNTDKIEE